MPSSELLREAISGLNHRLRTRSRIMTMLLPVYAMLSVGDAASDPFTFMGFVCRIPPMFPAFKSPSAARPACITRSSQPRHRPLMRRTAAVRADDDSIGGSIAGSSTSQGSSCVVSARWITADPRDGWRPRAPRCQEGWGRGLWSASPSTYVLFALGDARRTGESHPRARGAPGSFDDAALHAPESGGARCSYSSSG